MSTLRQKVLVNALDRVRTSIPNGKNTTFTAADFGKRLFNASVIEKMLPKAICQNLINAAKGTERLNPAFADAVAVAMKEWALSHGATHFTHWFQPLTGGSAEKHDAFWEWNRDGRFLESFSGKQLIQGEPDASSFPSGGLRSTYEARGYTGWDPTSPPFLWEGGDGLTLCIPSIFFSWTGDVLDSKIPLLRSDAKLNAAVLRLLQLSQVPATHVYSTLGLEQEYFVLDRALKNSRPDLLMNGRTVFGAAPSKGQELQDHYFGAVKDRILAFMQDFEKQAIELGIPVKTRHNEVAPAQHEIAPVFEKASLAIDHNIILMELMRQTATKHGLSCLLHEKPFQGINGSGKHSNWSLSTDTGYNLLDPAGLPGNQFHFLVLLIAIIHGVHRHSDLLRASIGSASNDYRLGGHEAPPAIISIYLGAELEAILHQIETKGTLLPKTPSKRFDLGLSIIPELTQDQTDRNRTSPFAFTGNKFEFRAVGSSMNPAFPITVLNAIVAESLNEILDAIEAKVSSKPNSPQKLLDESLPVLRKYIKEGHPVCFAGDNYSEAWVKEAKKRGLPILKLSPHSFETLTKKGTDKLFQDILKPHEIKGRQEILHEAYFNHLNIEVNLMTDLFKNQIAPATRKALQLMSESLLKQKEILGTKGSYEGAVRELSHLNALFEEALNHLVHLEKAQHSAQRLETPAKKALFFAEKIKPLMESFRETVDQLEQLVDDPLWPLMKYRELLYLV